MASNIDRYLNYLKNTVLSNQNLCKYLYYNDKNPLSQPDIVDTNASLYLDKRNQKLFVTPFTFDVTDQTKTTLTIMIDNFRIDNKSNYYEDINVYFIIACNVRLWELDDGSGEVKLRVNGVWDELNRTFKRQYGVGLGKNHFQNGRIQKFNDYFWGYTWCLSATDFPFDKGL